MLDTNHASDILFSYVAFENKYHSSPGGSNYMNRIIYNRYCHNRSCNACILDMGDKCYISKLTLELEYDE